MTRKRVTITMTDEVHNYMRIWSRQTGLPMSRIIEQTLKNAISDHKKKKEDDQTLDIFAAR